MALGFKVADAYVDLHTKDSTKGGRDQIGRDTDRWSKKEGEKSGQTFGRAFAKGLMSMGRVIGAALLKTVLFGGLIGVAGAAIAGLAGYLIQATAAAKGLVVALAQAMGIFLLLPGVIFVALSALAGLKLAMSGLGAALKAGFTGDMAAFQKAMKDLGPQTQAFVKALVALKTPFQTFKKLYQDSVFGGLAPEVKGLGTEWLALLTKSFAGPGGIGMGLHSLLAGLIADLRDANTKSDFVAIFANVAKVIANLSGLLRPLLAILRDVGVVATAVLAQMSVIAQPILDGWAKTVDAMRESGRLNELITNSLVALRILGNLLMDLWHIITGIASAAGDSNMFTWFAKIADWINSPAGQGALTQIFQALRAAADALSPALFTLGKVLGDLFAAFSDTMVAIGPVLNQLIGALGAELVRLIPILTPMVVQLGNVLLVALPPLGTLIEMLLRLAISLAPGVIAILQGLQPAFDALAQVAPILGNALSDLLVALAPLLTAAGPLLAVLLNNAARAVQVLAVVLAPLIDLIGQVLTELGSQYLEYMLQVWPLLADAFLQVVDAARPLVPVLIKLFREGISKIFDAFERNRPAIEQMLPQLVAAFVDLAKAGVDVGIALAPLIPILTDVVVQLIDKLAPILPQLIPMVVQLAEAFVQILQAFTEKNKQGHSLLDVTILMVQLFANNFVLAITALAWVISNLLIPVLQLLVDWFTFIYSSGADLMTWFNNLPGRIREKVAGFGSLLFNAGRDLIQGLINGIQSMLSGLWNLINGIGDKIKGVFNGVLEIGSPSQVFYRSGVDTVDGYMLGARSRLGALAGLMKSIAATVADQAAGLRLPEPALAGASGPAPIMLLNKVYLGDREIREVVKEEISDNPAEVAKAANEGNRRKAFTDPARRGRK